MPCVWSDGFLDMFKLASVLMPLQHAPLPARYDVVHCMTFGPPMPVMASIEHFCTKLSVEKSKLRKVLG